MTAQRPKGYPHKQPFNIKSPNHTRKKGWWTLGFNRRTTKENRHD